jgi:AAA+ superfamily predicted ATPase
MTGTQTLAELLAEEAILLAGKFMHQIVRDVHLLAAIACWDPETFVRITSVEVGALTSFLASTKGDSKSVKGVGEDVAEALRRIGNSVDVLWEVVSELSEMLPTILEIPDVSGAERPEVYDDVVWADEVDVDPLNSFPITQALVSRVAHALRRPMESTTRAVLEEAHAAARMVLDGDPLSLRRLISRGASCGRIVFDPKAEFSTLVRDVSMQPTTDASRTATQLALALVRVSMWALTLKIDGCRGRPAGVDAVRLEMRQQLGSRLTPATDRLSKVDQHFGDLVGMQSVKRQLRMRVNFLDVSRRNQRQNQGEAIQRMHAAFVGNPGTGKTTMARLYGAMLNELGLLPSKRFVEVDRAEIVGQYIGHTEANMLRVIDSADGGVLFIDEAYALNDAYGRGYRGFGDEATTVLLRQMEERKQTLVVILAGYRAEMNAFLDSNPGLRSRVPLVVEFPDYSKSELGEICRRRASRLDLTLEPAALEKIESILDSRRGQRGFGNAREVENLLDAARVHQSDRLMALGDFATAIEQATVVADDVQPLSGASDTDQAELPGYL